MASLFYSIIIIIFYIFDHVNILHSVKVINNFPFIKKHLSGK